jgi:CheY-like chemotaxis protein
MMPGLLDQPPVVVLVAEDETLLRLMTGDMLADADYQVVEARDGQEALAILSSQTAVGALLTDVNMPNVDGLALAKIVRQRWPYIGIVVTSGRQMPSGLPEGARFISKPYRQEQLLHEIKSVIAEAAAHAGQHCRE